MAVGRAGGCDLGGCAPGRREGAGEQEARHVGGGGQEGADTGRSAEGTPDQVPLHPARRIAGDESLSWMKLGWLGAGPTVCP